MSFAFLIIVPRNVAFPSGKRKPKLSSKEVAKTDEDKNTVLDVMWENTLCTICIKSMPLLRLTGADVQRHNLTSRDGKSVLQSFDNVVEHSWLKETYLSNDNWRRHGVGTLMVVLVIIICVIAGRYVATNKQNNSQGERFAQSTEEMQAKKTCHLHQMASSGFLNMVYLCWIH